MIGPEGRRYEAYISIHLKVCNMCGLVYVAHKRLFCAYPLYRVVLYRRVTMILDSAQQVVVSHGAESLLVLAGPGSGKTASITGRTARLIQEEGVNPEQLLSVTFSKKAANEMRERLASQCDPGAAELASIHTFHALGDRIMKLSPSDCSREHGYTIIDEGDQRALFSRVLKEQMGMDRPGKYDYRKWLSAYVRMGQDGVAALDSTYAQAFSDSMYRFAGIERLDQMRWLWTAFSRFEASKKEQNVVDFNDLLILPLQAFNKVSGFSEAVADFYPFITVDESQDTSRVQYDMVRSLAKGHGNLVMVGDDDQSLYGWRGANAGNLRQFIQDFSPQIHKLERNYRSSSHLVEAAASHIAHNQYRLRKKPFSARDENEKPWLSETSDNREMTANIVSLLKARHEGGVGWEDQAILYRKNRVGEALEPALMKAGIPYEVQGGPKLSDRKEVRLALAIARLVHNPKDHTAFAMIAKGIKGLGERGVEKHADECAESHGGNLLAMTDWMEKRQGPSEALKELRSVCADLAATGPRDLIDVVVERWGLEGYFPDDKPEQTDARGQRLRLFERWVQEAVAEAPKGEDPWLIMQRSLLEDPESDMAEGRKVTLSTVHRAKGLEWPIVHIAGYSDGLMPMRGKTGEVDDPEEERNISYVAMTRAADELYMHHTSQFYLGYETLELEPSPFLSEFDWERMGARQPAPCQQASEPETEEGGIANDLGLPGWAI